MPIVRRTAARATVVLVVLGLVVGGISAALAGGQRTRRPRPFRPPVETMEVMRVAQLTGAGSINRTDLRWNVHGADLGHPILHDGELYLVFGDTWGSDWTEGDEWRSNTLARVESPDPREGLVFADMISDESGHAAELLPSLKKEGVEQTVIPTYGISTGDRMVLHYMSVRRWISPGRWELDHAGFAWSDDGGHSWTMDDEAVLPGDGNFGQVAMVDHDGYVYVFGIPGGRFGDVRLARVAPNRLMSPDDYEYWNGFTWTHQQAAAATIVPAPVGELSVRWNDTLERWLMMYLDEHRDAVVLRTAAALTGPWDQPRVVTTAREYPMLYAPYMLPDTEPDDDLYFTLSEFGPYQVSLMKVPLGEVEPA